MTKRLTTNEKASNLVKEIFRITSKSCDENCQSCTWKKNDLKHVEKLFGFTHAHCPRNQIRVLLQMSTGIDRRNYDD